MSKPLFVRDLTAEERTTLEAGLRSREAFVLRRCQILLASAVGKKPAQIASALACASQTARNAIRAFHQDGLDCLTEGSTRPKTVRPVLTAQKRERLLALLHQSPRLHGKGRSAWTLGLLAEVAQEQGLSDTVLSAPTMLDAVRRLGADWKRAKHWISSPAPRLRAEKNRRDRLIGLLAKRPEWQLAFQDEVWWSRLAQPHLKSWTGGWAQDRPLALVEKGVAKADTEPKAVACYGALPADTGQMLLRFVDGRPISAVTCEFLGWLADKTARAGKRGLVLIWDNASWHISRIVKDWLRAHNRRVRKEGGCRLVVCHLLSKSPWLNNIEPKWPMASVPSWSRFGL
jgi:transposase